MPRGDRTGPRAGGPMTGRAMGYCAGYSVPGFMNPIGGYGRGLGRARGRGFRRGWGRGFGGGWIVYPPPAVGQPVYPLAYPSVAQPQSSEQEVAVLENYQKELEADKADLEQEMDGVKARIEELKTKLKK